MAPNGDFLSSCRVPPIGHHSAPVQSQSTSSSPATQSEEKQRIRRCLFGQPNPEDTQRMFASENEQQNSRIKQFKTMKIESVHENENIKNLPNCISKEFERPAIEEATMPLPVQQSRSESVHSSSSNVVAMPCTPQRKRQRSMTEYHRSCKLKNKVKSVDNCTSSNRNKCSATSTSTDTKTNDMATTSGSISTSTLAETL